MLNQSLGNINNRNYDMYQQEQQREHARQILAQQGQQNQDYLLYQDQLQQEGMSRQAQGYREIAELLGYNMGAVNSLSDEGIMNYVTTKYPQDAARSNFEWENEYNANTLLEQQEGASIAMEYMQTYGVDGMSSAFQQALSSGQYSDNVLLGMANFGGQTLMNQLDPMYQAQLTDLQTRTAVNQFSLQQARSGSSGGGGGGRSYGGGGGYSSGGSSGAGDASGGGVSFETWQADNFLDLIERKPSGMTAAEHNMWYEAEYEAYQTEEAIIEQANQLSRMLENLASVTTIDEYYKAVETLTAARDAGVLTPEQFEAAMAALNTANIQSDGGTE